MYNCSFYIHQCTVFDCAGEQMSSTMGGRHSSSHREQFCLSDAFYKCFGLWGRNDAIQDESSVNKSVICCCCRRMKTVNRKQPSSNHRAHSNGSCNIEHPNDEEFSKEVCTSNNTQVSVFHCSTVHTYIALIHF